MKVQLYSNRALEQERIDIHYRQMSPLIKRVIAIVGSDTGKTQLIAKSEDGQQIYVHVDDILYFDSVDKRTYLYLKQAIYEIQEKLSDIEKLLESDGFIRINKSVVVNIYHIESIKPEINMRVSALLDNGEKMMINRSYKKSFVDFLKARRNI